MPQWPTARRTPPDRAVGYARFTREMQRMVPTMEQAAADLAERMHEMTTVMMNMQPTVPGCTCPSCRGLTREQRDAEIKAAQARALAAQERGMKLLRACLSPRQRTQMDVNGWFEATGSEGGRYRIVTGRGSVSGNVLRLDGKGRRVVTGYCAHAREAMPTADHWLLQKLALEADEAGFLRVAAQVYVY